MTNHRSPWLLAATALAAGACATTGLDDHAETTQAASAIARFRVTPGVDGHASSRNDAPADFAAGAPFRQPNGVASAGTLQELYGPVRG